MKRTIFIPLSIIIILVFGMPHYVFSGEAFEKGDAIYSDLGDPGNPVWYVGHAGLYWKWNQSGDPNDYSSHWTIESNRGPGVHVLTFFTFHDAGNFWNVMTRNLTYAQRNTIVQTAKHQADLNCTYEFFAGYKSPGVSFRCDGLVEYCYQQAGIDLVPNDTWDTMWPWYQMQKMSLQTQAKVNELSIISPSIKDVTYPYYKGTINLKAFANDSNYGSGIAKVEVWRGAPDTGELLDKDDHDESISGKYENMTWSTSQNEDGKHLLYFRCFDQAGNEKSVSAEIVVDNTPPFTVTNLDSTHETNKWYNKDKASITTTWTAAQDDKTYANDVSGIGGYGVLWNTSATSLPPEQKTIEAVTSTTSGALPDGKQYFHIRSVDKAGNWDDAAVHIGPFWIDITSPNIAISIVKEIPGATLPGGKKWIKARIFRVTVTDPIVNDARSGLKEVFINGAAQALTQGQASWSGETYVETPAWIKVKAVDAAGNEAYGDKINPDPYFIQAPRWENINDLDIPFEDYAISPKTSVGVKDNVTINYTLEKPAQVTIRIYDKSGNLAKTIKDAYENSGTYSFTWDGKNNSSAFMANAQYYYFVEAIDYLSDKLILENYGLVIVDNTLPAVVIDSLTPDTPSWGVLTLKARATEANLDDIRVFYKLRTSSVYNNVTPQNIKLLSGTWNIALDTSSWADGLYDVKVEALDFAGNTAAQVKSPTIKRAVTTNVKLYDIKTGVDYNSSPYSAYIEYFLSKQANVKIEILTPSMSLVKQIVNATQAFGRNTACWDGTNAGGAQVAGGPYKYRITSSGDPTLSMTGDITLKKVKCYISCPWQDSLVRAYVPVEGLAAGSEFKNYKLEYGEGKEPVSWTTISESTNQINDSILGNWDTGYEFESYCSPVPYPYEGLIGEYTLRLTVQDTGGNEYQDRVTVIVGRVISNELGGEGKSPDDKVHLIVEPLTLQGSFEVVSIMPVELPTILPADKVLIGKIYELQPPMLGFSKPAVLTMGYTQEDVGSQSESKLGIYIWDTLKKRWEYMDTTKDSTNNILSAEIIEIPRYHAYAAILADNNPPQKPVIFWTTSPIYRQSAHIFGTAEPQSTVKLFNNSKLKIEQKADYKYGWFSAYLKDLISGTNAFTAKSVDPSGNESVLSSSRSISVQLKFPTSVLSVKLKTPDFLGNYTASTVKVGDTLYIELQGTDSSAATTDIAQVKLAASISSPTGIVVSLTETGKNTGIYRGLALVGIRSDENNRTIGAVNNDLLTISSVQKSTIYTTINVESAGFIDAPSVYSTSHPSVCQNTFEDTVGEWANRSGAVGATVLRDNTTSKTGVYSAKITNEHDGGDFSCYAVTSSYDAEDHPVISFDYKITPDVKTNFKVKVNGTYKDIIFADDPETDGSAIKTIGEVEGVIKDGRWHHAEINLYKMLKKDDPSASRYIVEEIIMGDWDMTYWYSTVPGNSNSQGAAYWIDNFIISKYIIDDSKIEVAWDSFRPNVTGYSYILDHSPDTIPDKISEGPNTYVEYAALGDGIWYFHIASCDGAGNRSLPNHYLIVKDRTSPALAGVSPSDGETSGSADINLQIIDSVIGVDRDSISVEAEGVLYNLTNPGLTYDETTAIISFKPYHVAPVPIVFTNGQIINVRLNSLSDKAGNSISPYSWSWTYSLSGDVTPPEPPAILYPLGHDVGLSSVTFSWEAADTSGIDGYSYILDGIADTAPDDTSLCTLTEKNYPNLPEGTYYFHIKAKDKAGNWSETTHFMINIAHTALLVDDFNDGSDPNKLGGASGVFDSGSGSYCHKGYVNGVILGSSGYSMMLNYYTVGTNSYSGYRMSLNHANLTSYKSLSFWVKGGQNGEKFKVGLKDSSSNESKINVDLYLKGGASTEWQQVIIPLVMFKSIKNWADMDNFSIAFENAVDPSGDIYIENIEFISENGRVVVDNFDDGKDPNAFGANYYTVTGGGATMTMSYALGAGIEGTICYKVNYNGVQLGKYCSLVMYLADINVSDTDTLSFYARGNAGNERPNIYLYDGTNRAFVDIENYKTITTSWQKIDIPLTAFTSQGVSLTHVRELSFVFEWETTSGMIFLDNVEFINYALSMEQALNNKAVAVYYNLSGNEPVANTLQNGTYPLLITDVTARENTAPILALINNKIVNEGSRLEIAATAEDINSDSLTCTVIKLPQGAVFTDNHNGRGSFSWTPDYTQAGAYNVIFTVSDGILTDSEAVVITVNNLYRPSEIILPQDRSSFTVDEGKLLEFQVKAYDPDLVRPILETVNLPESASLEEAGKTTDAIPVSTWQQLQAIRTGNLAASYYIVNDITIPDGVTFTPIAENNQNPFTGTLDGCGYAISNLESSTGLFGYVSGSTAKIKNLRLLNVNIAGGDYAGAVAGNVWDQAQVTNVYATGSVKGNYSAGGLVGSLCSGQIIGSASSVNVEGPKFIGGLTGQMARGHAGQPVPLIKDSYATGSINNTGTGQWAISGGVIGWRIRGDIENTYATGKITGGALTGGLLGYDSNPAFDTFKNSYWNIETTGKATSAGNYGEGKTAAQMIQDSTYLDWDFANTWTKDTNSYPNIRFLGTAVKTFRWAPSGTQGRSNPYIIGFDSHDGETNPQLPDDSIDVYVTANDAM